MASIHKDIPIDAIPNDVWAAVRDFGAVHTRLVPGFVTDTKLDGDARIVTFANGKVAREQLVDCDEARRRLVYAMVNERVKHHSASVQVFADGDARSRLVWIVDVLPNEIAPYIDAQMDQAARAMQKGLAGAPHDDFGFSRYARRRRPAADRAGKMDLYGRFVGSWMLRTAPAVPRAPGRASVPSASGSRCRQDNTPSTTIELPPARRSSAPSRRASTATSRRRR